MPAADHLSLSALQAWVDRDPPTARDLRRHLEWNPDAAVMGDDRAVAIAVPRMGAAVVSFLAVDPAARGEGRGAALLSEVETWAEASGLPRVVIGPSAPAYLWPGVEVGLTALETMLFGRAYRVERWEVNQEVRLPQDLPAGRAGRARPSDRDSLVAFCREDYPHWEAEVRFSFAADPPTCALWEDDGEVLGFACWSVVREGWFGPMATRPDLRGGRGGRGVGTGTLAVALQGLHEEGRETAEIAWVGPERFYTKVAGARVHRVFRVFARDL